MALITRLMNWAEWIKGYNRVLTTLRVNGKIILVYVLPKYVWDFVVLTEERSDSYGELL